MTNLASATRTASMMTSSELDQHARNLKNKHFYDLVWATRPTPNTWSKVQDVFWMYNKQAILQRTHDLGLNDMTGVGFRVKFDIRSIRGTSWLIATLTPYEKNAGEHTHLRIWQRFMTEADFNRAKKEDAK